VQVAFVSVPLGSQAVIVAGEALVDLSAADRAEHSGALAMTARAGGSPANVAVGLARLGIPTRFAGRLSRDPLGVFLREQLARSGVDLALCVEARQLTTVALVGLDDAGAAAYSFYVEGTADWQWAPAELPPPEAGVAIHTGSLAIALEPGADVLAGWIAEQRASGAFISLDPNVRPALVLERARYRSRLDALIAAANVVKVSDEDLDALEPGVEPLATARSWAHRGPELVVVTHGAAGSTAVSADGICVHCDATAVSVVDTIGAGDAFTAGLLAFLADRGWLRAGVAAMLDRDALTQALRFAGRVAALTCERAGADPPTRAELDGALAAERD
jgi:fructokinase